MVVLGLLTELLLPTVHQQQHHVIYTVSIFIAYLNIKMEAERKEIRKLRKKLRQIEQLERLDRVLNDEEQEKVL